MPRYQRRDPLMGYNFQVSLLDSKNDDGVGMGSIVLSTSGLRTLAAFSEISGLEMTMEVEEYQAGGTNDHVLKFAGRVRWANLVLKRGLIAKRDPTDGSDLWKWYEGFLDGKGVRKDGIIVLLNEKREPKITWSFRRGLPLRWTGPSLDAGRSQVAVEAIEIAHEGIRRVKGGGELGEAIGAVADALF